MARDLRHIEHDFDIKTDATRRVMTGPALKAAREVHKRGFQKSFELGRFNDTGSRRWVEPKRKQKGEPFPPPTRSHRTRATLIGSRGGGLSGLKGSFKTFKSGSHQVTIENTKEYAAIHNEGGTIKTKVTEKFRKFAWAMYYKTKDESWKGLALTKKKILIHKIPKRQFMGTSSVIRKEAMQEINYMLDKAMNKE